MLVLCAREKKMKGRMSKEKEMGREEMGLSTCVYTHSCMSACVCVCVHVCALFDCACAVHALCVCVCVCVCARVLAARVCVRTPGAPPAATESAAMCWLSACVSIFSPSPAPTALASSPPFFLFFFFLLFPPVCRVRGQARAGSEGREATGGLSAPRETSHTRGHACLAREHALRCPPRLHCCLPS